jgi:hypothetical protein
MITSPGDSGRSILEFPPCRARPRLFLPGWSNVGETSRPSSPSASPTSTSQRENVYRTFRFTPKTARLVTVWGAIVPGLVGLTAWSVNVSG